MSLRGVYSFPAPDLASRHETRLIRMEKDLRAVKSKMGAGEMIRVVP